MLDAREIEVDIQEMLSIVNREPNTKG